jgi:hypothetical protein
MSLWTLRAVRKHLGTLHPKEGPTGGPTKNQVETTTGKKRKTVYGKTREEAHEKMIDALSNRNKGLIFEGYHQTLETYFAGWLQDIESDLITSTFSLQNRIF